MRAMLLAAGRGQRLRPRTDTIPKALIEVHGQSLIERHLFNLSRAGCDDVVVNLGWLGSMVSSRLGNGSRYGLHIVYSEEGWPALDTGGGIRRALPLLGCDPFLVINADIWTDYPFSSLIKQSGTLAIDDMIHMVMVPNPPHNSRGDFGLQSGRVVMSNPLHTFSGLSILRPALFCKSPDGPFPIAPLWRRAIRTGLARGELYEGAWCDVGTEERLQSLNINSCGRT